MKLIANTVNAQSSMFHASAVKSPPLLGEKNMTEVNGVEETVFVVEDYELNGLINEYLM